MKQTDKAMVTMTTRIPKDLLRRIKDLSGKTGLRMEHIMKQALQAWMERQ
jgi:hypothetical protein